MLAGWELTLGLGGDVLRRGGAGDYQPGDGDGSDAVPAAGFAAAGCRGNRERHGYPDDGFDGGANLASSAVEGNVAVRGSRVAAGFPLRFLLLSEFNPTALRLAIVVIILGLGLMSLCNIWLPGARRRWMAPAVGCATTFLVTTFAVGAPLAALYAIEQDWSREEIRATLALYFLLAAMGGDGLVCGGRHGGRYNGAEHWDAGHRSGVWGRRWLRWLPTESACGFFATWWWRLP